MATFSSILSSIGGQPKAPQQQPSSNATKSVLPNSTRLTPNNAAAGIKRKSQEPGPAPRPKTAKTEQDGSASRTTAPASRPQPGSKPNAPPRPNGGAANSLPPRLEPLTAAQKSKATHRPTTILTPPSTADGNAAPKRGFAAIMARANAAQAAAKASGPSTIKHKTTERLTKRDRLRLKEETKASPNRKSDHNRSRSGTPQAGAATKTPKLDTGYKGTMQQPQKRAKLPQAPLTYKGTMRAATSPNPSTKQKAKKGGGQDKYGGYASWSDLSDAASEDEDEGGNDSEASSDMEGGFDDVAQEELLSARTARKEDDKALEEEKRHALEKIERKRRLQALSKSAAAGKKRY